MPKAADERQHYSFFVVLEKYMNEMGTLLTKLRENEHYTPQTKVGEVQLGIASSHNLPLQSQSIDSVITSPPYCTRIDYPIMTRLELALLHIVDEEFEQLRRQMIGAPLMNPEKF